MFFFRERQLGATCCFFSREVPTQVPEINATCFFFSSMVNGLKSTCIFFSFWRACGARNFHFPLVFLPWRACGAPNSWISYVFCLGVPATCHIPGFCLHFLPWHTGGMPWRVCFFRDFLGRQPQLTCYVFFAPLARINVLCFFFAGFCKFGRNYRVMFFFAGTCEKS